MALKFKPGPISGQIRVCVKLTRLTRPKYNISFFKYPCISSIYDYNGARKVPSFFKIKPAPDWVGFGLALFLTWVRFVQTQTIAIPILPPNHISKGIN